ncbi:MAG: M28 family metallopeptidase, partial [Halobacteria archaeon]|nr:M28 family metallopeptidase [Halobacteria archaeon]
MDRNVDWIGEAFTSDAGWEAMEGLVDIRDRMAGSDGEERAAEVTREALAEHVGSRLREEEFGIKGWERVSSSLEHPDGEEDCVGLPRSPSARAEGELIDLGAGLPEDFEGRRLSGKVVMVSSDTPDYYERFVHRREKYDAAVEGGAAGFVFRSHVDGCLPPTGSVGGQEGEAIGEIPAVGVSKEVGARLSRRYEGEEVGVEVEADIGDATSRNVHARLGPETEERVLVTCHIDAHDVGEGAVDNGAGVGALVEVAKALGGREDELGTQVELVAYGAEEVGLCGSEHHAETTDTENVRAVVNNDGLCRSRTLEFHTHGFDSLGDAVRRTGERFGHPVDVVPRHNPHSDHWPFVKKGVPGYHVRSNTENRDRGWGHTSADTLDKIERRGLREQSILITGLVEVLAD